MFVTCGMSQKPAIASREWAVSFSGGATLAFSAWALGGMNTLTLHLLLFGGIFTFLITFIPLPRRLRSPLTSLHFPNESLTRLLKWPFFYYSLAFLVYLLIGALNPAAEVVSDERGWWIEAIQAPLASWLPTSVRSDYQEMNAWRVLASFTAAFTLIWGLWAGLTRRKAVLLVLWSLLVSGALMALVGILQYMTHADAVLWTFPSSNQHFWGSFFYRNQGVAFLNLILVNAGLLFFYHATKARERFRSGGPHFLCILLFAGVATSIGLALSRGGILVASILCLVYLALLLVFVLRGLEAISSFWMMSIPAVLSILGVAVFVQYVDVDRIEDRFGDVWETIVTADEDARAISSQATWEMAQPRLWQGWGAGSFRYVFPMYQRNYPKIFYARYHKEKGWIGRRAYHYAHNDILQFIAEYGLVGSGIVTLAIGSLLMSLILNIQQAPFAILLLFVGYAASTCHACFDFIFNSPAYWMAFVGLLCLSCKLIKLECMRSKVIV